MKILVTGISGFVGPYLKDCLESAGYTVFGTDRNQSDDNNPRMYFGDILDAEKMQQIITEIEPDGIIHLAGFSSVKKSFDEPELCRKINVDGTKNILEAALKLKKPPRIVIITSAEVYGTPQFVPMTESHPLKPTSPYGKSRDEQELLAQEYVKNLPIIILRSFNHTGPGQRPEFVVARFVNEIVNIEKGIQTPEISVGNLEAIRDFTDVRDVVEAYKMAFEKGEAGETYNVCSGVGRKIDDILQNILKMSSEKITLKSDPTLLRPSDIPNLTGSHQKFTNATGWQPLIPFEQTLNDMLNWCRSG